MINILYTILIVFMMSLSKDIKQDIKVNQNAKASVSNSVQDKLDKKSKILQFIKLVQPKYSDKKAAEIRDAIILYSDKYKIDPFLTTAVAYVESEFEMESKPCIGIMQLVKSSIRFYDPKKIYNAYTVDGNIAIGCIEIAKHFNTIRGNGLLPSRSALRFTLLRYNGSNQRYSYALKVMRVKNRLNDWEIDKIKLKLKKSMLWKE